MRKLHPLQVLHQRLQLAPSRRQPHCTTASRSRRRWRGLEILVQISAPLILVPSATTPPTHTLKLALPPFLFSPPTLEATLFLHCSPYFFPASASVLFSSICRIGGGGGHSHPAASPSFSAAARTMLHREWDSSRCGFSSVYCSPVGL